METFRRYRPKETDIVSLSTPNDNNATINDNFVNFNVTLFFMDLVDISTDQTRDYFRGNDNKFDILNTQLALATRVMRVLQKRTSYTDSRYWDLHHV